MRLLVLTALFAFLTDQGSKYGVLYGLGLAETGRLDILPPFLVFISGMNTGINFGLFANAPDAARWGLVALAVAVSVGIAIWAQRSFQTTLEFLCAGC